MHLRENDFKNPSLQIQYFPELQLSRTKLSAPCTVLWTTGTLHSPCSPGSMISRSITSRFWTKVLQNKFTILLIGYCYGNNLNQSHSAMWKRLIQRHITVATNNIRVTLLRKQTASVHHAMARHFTVRGKNIEIHYISIREWPKRNILQSVHHGEKLHQCHSTM